MANSFTYQDQTINVGDTVSVHQKIVEEDKSRNQIFTGIIIAVSGSSEQRLFTVRKISTNSIGVERIFPVNSPNLTQIEVKTKGHVKRSKLYYLRDRSGRQAIRVKEKLEKIATKAE